MHAAGRLSLAGFRDYYVIGFSMKSDEANVNSQDLTLRVCSYNIHKGFNIANTQFLLKEIRHAIRLVNADMLFLQEVVGENIIKASSVENWVPETQFEFLADSVWPHHAYGKNSVYNHGHHGNAILSRYSLEDWGNTDLSVIPTSNRGLLHARILGGINLFCVHCGLLGAERKAQLKKMVTVIRRCAADNEPIILAGDFNDWQNKAGLYLKNELDLSEVFTETYGRPKATFPAMLPFLPMDRIYFRGLDLQEAEVLTGSPWNRLSDHCAIFAEFKVNKTGFK
jgi:endonuclease/exonuclease/phosphatase family metal-dependent hydrolase